MGNSTDDEIIKPVEEIRKPKPNEEPTTPSALLDVRPIPEKLQIEPTKSTKTNQFKADIKIIRATQAPNAKFVIESIKVAPGRYLGSYQQSQRVYGPPNMQIRLRSQPIRSQPLRSQNLRNRSKILKRPIRAFAPVATAKGQTSADKPVRDAPNLFFRNSRQFNEPEYTSLILEPSARSIVGNNGVAVSAPLSRAFLRSGHPTRVLFKPDSVAIAGPGGKAHAHADLILSFIKTESDE